MDLGYLGISVGVVLLRRMRCMGAGNGTKGRVKTSGTQVTQFKREDDEIFESALIYFIC